jgi:hypothetical protein
MTTYPILKRKKKETLSLPSRSGSLKTLHLSTRLNLSLRASASSCFLRYVHIIRLLNILQYYYRQVCFWGLAIFIFKVRNIF